MDQLEDLAAHRTHGPIDRTVVRLAAAVGTPPSCQDHPAGCELIRLACPCGIVRTYHAGHHIELPDHLADALDQMMRTHA